MKTIFPAISYLLAVISTIILTIGPMAHSRGTIKLASDRDNIGFLRRYSSTGEAGITASAGIGNDEYTVLLLHMDGTDASPTFTDSSTGGAGSPHTATANGNAQIDTAQSKFGGASGLFDGSGDYLSIPDSDDWYFATGAWTIDFWVRPNITLTSGSPQTAFVAAWEEGNFAFLVDYTNGVVRCITVPNSGSTSGLATASYTTYLAANTWYHIAAVSTGTQMTVYLNGVGGTPVTAGNVANNTTGVAVGCKQDGVSETFFNGHIDELRISKGIARTNDPNDYLYDPDHDGFTPPDAPYGQ